MKKKNFNTRTCILTNKKLYKEEMVRITKINNQVILGPSSSGRGYYFDPKTEIPLSQVVAKINRRLNVQISESEISLILNSRR